MGGGVELFCRLCSYFFQMDYVHLCQRRDSCIFQRQLRQHMDISLWLFSGYLRLGWRRNPPPSITHFFYFGLYHRILMMINDAAESQLLTAGKRIAVEIIVSKAEVVGMICLNVYSVCRSNAFVCMVLLECWYTCHAGYQVVVHVVGEMTHIEEWSPETLVY